jgi:hypothetical protein
MNNAAWQRTRREAGLQPVRIHDLRATFASRLRAVGVSMEDREVLLGHANHSMAGHYASADVGRLTTQAGESDLESRRNAHGDTCRECGNGPVDKRSRRPRNDITCGS